MKRKDIVVGQHYAEARSATARYAHEVVAIDAGEWYEVHRSVWTRETSRPVFTLADGSVVQHSTASRVTRTGQRATHVWVRLVRDDGGLSDPELMPLSRIREPWSQYVERRDAEQAAARVAQNDLRTRLANTVAERIAAQERLRILPASVLDHVPASALDEVKINADLSGVRGGEVRSLSVVALERLVSAAYEAGRTAR